MLEADPVALPDKLRALDGAGGPLADRILLRGASAGALLGFATRFGSNWSGTEIVLSESVFSMRSSLGMLGPTGRLGAAAVPVSVPQKLCLRYSASDTPSSSESPMCTVIG